MRNTNGWVVEAVVPAVGTSLVRRRYLFAVCSDRPEEAERMVRARLGGLHCTVDARLKLAPRAVANLNIVPDRIQEIRP
jgi:hypothetical protein